MRSRIMAVAMLVFMSFIAVPLFISVSYAAGVTTGSNVTSGPGGTGVSADFVAGLSEKVARLEVQLEQYRNRSFFSDLDLVSFLVMFVTLVVAVAGFLLPYFINKKTDETNKLNKEKTDWVVEECKRKAEEIGKITEKAQEDADSINSMKSGIGEIGKSLDIIKRTFKLNGREQEAVNAILESPVAPFLLTLKASAFMAQHQKRFEVAAKIWDILRVLGRPDDFHETGCYFFWGNTFSNNAESLANLDEKLKAYSDAFGKYERAVEINDNEFGIWTNWGAVLCDYAEILVNPEEKLRTYREAFGKYQRAVKINKGDYNAWYNWGGALSKHAEILVNPEEKLKAYREAFGKFERAINIEENKYEVWFNWGSALGNYAIILIDPKNKLEAYREAVDKLKTSLEFQETSETYSSLERTLKQMADLLDKQGKTAEAETLRAESKKMSSKAKGLE